MHHPFSSLKRVNPAHPSQNRRRMGHPAKQAIYVTASRPPLVIIGTDASISAIGVTAGQKVNDSQEHQQEGIDKEPAISQHENVTENYGSHIHGSQCRAQSGCLRDEE